MCWGSYFRGYFSLSTTSRWVWMKNLCLSLIICCDMSRPGLHVCVSVCENVTVCELWLKSSEHGPKLTITSKCICALKPSNEVGQLGFSFCVGLELLKSCFNHTLDAYWWRSQNAATCSCQNQNMLRTHNWVISSTRFVLLSVLRQITGEKAH